jgi:hypothetical protein
MATYELIESVSVNSGGAATLDFVSVGDIPTEYTDLVIVLSSRSERAGQALDTLELSLNGSTANRFSHRMYGTGSGAAGDGFTNGRIGLIDAATALANTFSSTVIYLPNVQKSVNKTALIQNVSEDQTVGSYQEYFAFIWKDNAALTSISLSATNGDLAEHTYASLYGVRNLNTASTPKATGGTITYDAVNEYWVHTFTASGSFVPLENLTTEYLVIAGGGGGGNWGPGGGGGAGGYRCSVAGESSGANSSPEATLNLTAFTGYTVTIGAGGAQNTNGNNTDLSAVTATGGGKGGGSAGNDADTGGSGGGGSGEGGSSSGASGTANQGKAGANARTVSGSRSGGGGGGASADGSTSGSGVGGTGGAGLTSSITGSAIGRAGGGGGAGQFNPGGSASDGGGTGGQDSGGTRGRNGFPGFGGGGGGGGASGGQGGSGIVIVRYAA